LVEKENEREGRKRDLDHLGLAPIIVSRADNLKQRHNSQKVT
jgi:hypothetical protein